MTTGAHSTPQLKRCKCKVLLGNGAHYLSPVHKYSVMSLAYLCFSRQVTSSAPRPAHCSSSATHRPEFHRIPVQSLPRVAPLTSLALLRFLCREKTKARPREGPRQQKRIIKATLSSLSQESRRRKWINGAMYEVFLIVCDSNDVEDCKL